MYVTFQAGIGNRNGDVIFIRQNKINIKKIEVNKSGILIDVLKVAEGCLFAF
jgi:hypothetical protein